MEDQQSNELIIINEMSDTHLDSTPALINGLVVAKRGDCVPDVTWEGVGLLCTTVCPAPPYPPVRWTEVPRQQYAMFCIESGGTVHRVYLRSSMYILQQILKQ
jgi:hypothetical protein